MPEIEVERRERQSSRSLQEGADVISDTREDVRAERAGNRVDGVQVADGSDGKQRVGKIAADAISVEIEILRRQRQALECRPTGAQLKDVAGATVEFTDLEELAEGVHAVQRE